MTIQLQKEPVGTKIMIYLFNNPQRKNYSSKITRNLGITLSSSHKNFQKLKKLELISNNKQGRIKYLYLTKKGKMVAELLYKIRRLTNE